jgi:CRISPR-associated protein Csb1
MTALTLERLRDAVAKDAAIRRIQRLQPAGGPGDKIFPPTYPGEGRNAAPRHVFEYRRVDGANVLCVLIDSVQSQANRLEESLKFAREEGAISFPTIAVDFRDTEVGDIGVITALDAPHRVFDAIVRDSQFNGTPFKETPEGRLLTEAKANNARSLYELSPATLLFGAWNSTQIGGVEGGGLGAKFPRCIVSEIVGMGVATEKSDGEERPSGRRTGSRIDPLGTLASVKVFKKAGSNTWTVLPEDAEKDRKGDPILFSGKKKTGRPGRPALINHGNVRPSVQEMLGVLSCAALRRLRFAGNATEGSQVDLAAQTMLAALGLVAALAQDRHGYFLRSRCDLVIDGSPSPFEIIPANGGEVDKIDLSLADACEVAKAASSAAERLGLRWRTDDLRLKPQDSLVQLVRQSREQALRGEGEIESDQDGGNEQS